MHLIQKWAINRSRDLGMDANNYETMGREPAKNTINSDHKFLYCSWHPFGKQKVRLNKYILSGSTNLPPVVTKKEVLCSRHIQLHLASHNISHISHQDRSVQRLWKKNELISMWWAWDKEKNYHYVEKAIYYQFFW